MDFFNIPATGIITRKGAMVQVLRLMKDGKKIEATKFLRTYYGIGADGYETLSLQDAKTLVESLVDLADAIKAL